MQLDAMEKRPVRKDTKKETQECYNYGIKKYLTKDCRKLKTRPGSQKK